MLLICLVSALVVFVSASPFADLSREQGEYGVDCSYPIHYGISKKDCPYFHQRYEKLMEGCYAAYSKQECDQNERERLQMNLDQPATQHNYTEIGFKKIRAPKEVWEPLIEFYETYKSKQKIEKWYRGNTIVNTWESPSYMISFENPDFKGGLAVKNMIWEGMKPIIEEWVGYQIEPTSLYGIRIYKEGSILATRKSNC